MRPIPYTTARHWYWATTIGRNRYNVFNPLYHGEALILDSNHGNWHQKIQPPYTTVNHWDWTRAQRIRIEIGIVSLTPLYIGVIQRYCASIPHIPQRVIGIEPQLRDLHRNWLNPWNCNPRITPKCVQPSYATASNWYRAPAPGQLEKYLQPPDSTASHRYGTHPWICTETEVLYLQPLYATVSHWYWTPTRGLASRRYYGSTY